ncbi:glycosyltransferase [Acidisoma cladoniae]|uniref:glycosyltransferase n=1 Tax=Acidisoma cladoniae TaxID=3040935 RepID=UPI00254F0186|nr:glycosyltransferase [Acidisoma sp. PAMC 29798]
MRFLIVHQNFPGQYHHLVRHLVAHQHEVVFLSEPNANQVPNVRKISYFSPRASDERIHRHAREFEIAIRRAEAAATAVRQIKALGFSPDIIIGHHGWGELLNLKDVFPAAPMLGYFEFFYKTKGQDVDFDPEFPTKDEDYPGVRSKNAVNLLALTLPGSHGQTPTLWQKSTYPLWAQEGITLLREGVDITACHPPAPRASRSYTLPNGFRIESKHKMVTYMARNLEPYRGFHVFMRALPAMQAERPDLHVTIVGNENVGYGAMPPDGSSWRTTIMREMEGKLDLDRIHFLGHVSYDTHLGILRRSDAHVYLTYPFVASWSLREAIASGCAIVGSDTPPVREFITDEETGLLVPFADPDALAGALLRLLEDDVLNRRLRANARRYAEASLDLDVYLREYDQLIERLTHQPLVHAKPKTVEVLGPRKRALKTR